MSFTFMVSAADWARIAPELVLTGMALLILLADLLLPAGAKASRASKFGAMAPVDPTGSRMIIDEQSVGQRSEGRRMIQGTGGRQASPSVRGTDSTATPAPTDRLYLILPSLSLLGLAGAFAATIVLFQIGDHQSAFFSMIGSDWGSLYAYIIILSASALAIMLSPAYLSRFNLQHRGEFYALMLLATIGMMIMAAATSFMTIFLGIEMLSLALYILCSFITRRVSSQESGMKYFLLSSFASAFLLYGIALTYGTTGSTSFADIHLFLARHVSGSSTSALLPPLPFQAHTLLLVAMGLLVVGFAFKVSAVPFQAWTPDVYDGAPAPVTAFMSVGTKAAALIAFARVFDIILNPVKPDWEPVIWAIAILTIIGGNVLALVQNNLKRLLAYSSIAHAGYLLIGVVVGGIIGISAILFYLLCYAFMNLGAFGIASVLEGIDNTGNDLSDIRGLWYRRPMLAGLLAFFMLALAGFPPMAGFAAKYYLFYAALQGGHPELLIIAVLASVLGMYYYLRVIAVMFMEKGATTAVATPAPVSGKRSSTQLSNMTTPARTGTATVVKTTTVNEARTVLAVETPTSSEPAIAWTTWITLAIAAIGTLLMGTLLPFWLVGLAQQAAQMMLLLK